MQKIQHELSYFQKLAPQLCDVVYNVCSALGSLCAAMGKLTLK